MSKDQLKEGGTDIVAEIHDAGEIKQDDEFNAKPLVEEGTVVKQSDTGAELCGSGETLQKEKPSVEQIKELNDTRPNAQQKESNPDIVAEIHDAGEIKQDDEFNAKPLIEERTVVKQSDIRAEVCGSGEILQKDKPSDDQIKDLNDIPNIQQKESNSDIMAEIHDAGEIQQKDEFNAKPLVEEGTDIKQIDQHVESHAGVLSGIQPLEAAVADVEKAEDLAVQLPYVCMECGDTFDQQCDLETHLYDHIAMLTGKPRKKDTCLKCPGRKFPDIKLHERHHKMGLECDVCGQAYSAAVLLAEHRMRAHTGERPFPCTVCSKSFVTSGELQRHLTKHTKETPFKCRVCGSCFQSRGAISFHMRTHNGEKSYSCPHCKHRSATSGSLKDHMRKHTGDKKCGSKFPTSGKKNSHVQSVHEVNSEKNLSCNICQKTFHRPHDLRLHVATHIDDRPFKCDECGARFSQKHSLKEHTQRHRGERPHKCMECGYSSAIKSCLLKHMKKFHLNEEFKCKHCSKQYSKEDELLAHVEASHKNVSVKVKKPFKCSDCDERFISATNLDKHRLHHHQCKFLLP